MKHIDTMLSVFQRHSCICQVIIWTPEGPISYASESLIVIFLPWYNCYVYVLNGNKMFLNWKKKKKKKKLKKKKGLYDWPYTKALQSTFKYSPWKRWCVNVASLSHCRRYFCISFIAQNRIILVVVNHKLLNLSSYLTTELDVPVLIRIRY